MNYLKKSSAYLIGSIDRNPEGGKGWRIEMSEWLENLGVTAINPHSKPFLVPQEDDQSRDEINKLKKEDKFQEIKDKYSYIRTVDLRCVDWCSFIVAQIDLNIHHVGTYEELFLANRQKKPILVNIVQGIENTPNWLILTLPPQYFFNSMEDIKTYLLDVNENGSTDHRWIFWK